MTNIQRILIAVSCATVLALGAAYKAAHPNQTKKQYMCTTPFGIVQAVTGTPGVEDLGDSIQLDATGKYFFVINKTNCMELRSK